MDFKSLNSPELTEIIKSGGVGILPTDTIYGVVGKALNKDAVERIYRLKGRNPSKPFIILISSLKDLERFKVGVDSKTQEFLERYWPGKISIILPCPSEEFEYLHRGTNSLAFRFPNFPELTSLIEKTGPLVAPSANPEGQEYAKKINEARNYFGEDVDFYVDKGKLKSSPSTLVSIIDSEVKILRQGEVDII